MIETPRVGDESLVYMYGLSDFWSEIFGDSELVEAILASDTISLGEAYSYFLQRAAGISLGDVEQRYGTRIKLLLVGDEDAVNTGDLTTFNIDTSIESTMHLSNRPILPTLTLDDGIHYEIRDGVLKLYRPIDTLGFPIRYTSTGAQQYAIWMVDAEINERWIDNSFGRLVGFTEEDAIFNYKSFLEGVYYLYANGPNISYIERGVNLAMGMPYARITEQVLAVNQDTVSGNWVIFTQSQAYTLPFGYRPNIDSGDTLTANQVIATWVEIRDHARDGAWWYDIYLPQEVLDSGTNFRDVGKCIPGSTGDTMMENFLKHHMFEVLITQPSGDVSSFDTARRLVLYSKPEYTFPVFVWRVPITDEPIDINDDLEFNLSSYQLDTCVAPPSIRFFDRGADDNPFNRGKHWYNRCQGSTYAATFLGYGDWTGNGGWAPEFDKVEPEYLSYLDRLMRTRGDTLSPHSRGDILRGWRGHVQNVDDEGNPIDDTPEGITWVIKGVDVYPGIAGNYEINERNLVPLYMMNREEMFSKMRTIDSRFQFNASKNRYVITGLNLVDVYNTWLVRDPVTLSKRGDIRNEFIDTTGSLDSTMSEFAKQSYLPSERDIRDDNGDPITDGTLFLFQNTTNIWSVYWIRTRVTQAPTLFPVEDQDYTRAIEGYDYNNLDTDYPWRGYVISERQQDITTTGLVGQNANYSENLLNPDLSVLRNTVDGFDIFEADPDVYQWTATSGGDNTYHVRLTDDLRPGDRFRMSARVRRIGSNPARFGILVFDGSFNVNNPKDIGEEWEVYEFEEVVPQNRTYNEWDLHNDTEGGTLQISELNISRVEAAGEYSAIITVGDAYLPTSKWNLADDGINIRLLDRYNDRGYAVLVPWSLPEKSLVANGTTYDIPEVVGAAEDITFAYSVTDDDYRFIHGYTIAPNGTGTRITLGTALPPGGNIRITFASRGAAPVDTVVATPSGTTYTVESGWYPVIFSDSGRIIPHNEYIISGTTLTFTTTPTDGFRVRYYPGETFSTGNSLFNRSSVQRNKARFLMDRGRENGRYDPEWDDQPVQYMNRSGRPWAEVPELGDSPVFADNTYVTRRLR